MLRRNVSGRVERNRPIQADRERTVKASGRAYLTLRASRSSARHGAAATKSIRGRRSASKVRGPSVSLKPARFCAALLVASGVIVSLASGQPQNQNSARAIPLASRSSPLAVVLTTDCGAEIDDQWALAHLALSPEVNLEAVITTHASSIRFSSATAVKHAAEVLARVSPGRVPAARLRRE